MKKNLNTTSTPYNGLFPLLGRGGTGVRTAMRFGIKFPWRCNKLFDRNVFINQLVNERGVCTVF